MPDTDRSWPIAPQPFFEEDSGSWLDRIAARYQTNVRLIWEMGTGLAMPKLTGEGWMLFPQFLPQR